MSLRETILSAKSKKLVPLEVPEWGCTVYVSSLSTRDFNHLVKLMGGGDTPDDLFARLVYLCACDSGGTRIFSEGDIPSIQDMDAEPVKRVALKAQEVNGFTDSAEALAEKNSEAIPVG